MFELLLVVGWFLCRTLYKAVRVGNTDAYSVQFHSVIFKCGPMAGICEHGNKPSGSIRKQDIF
jgi:hypothetical protein